MKKSSQLLIGLGAVALLTVIGGCASVPCTHCYGGPEIVLVPMPYPDPYPDPCPGPIIVEAPAPETPRRTPVPRTPQKTETPRTKIRETEQVARQPVVVRQDRSTAATNRDRNPVAKPRGQR
jgi:hypothetical protein